jgi:hypothetical protein
MAANLMIARNALLRGVSWRRDGVQVSAAACACKTRRSAALPPKMAENKQAVFIFGERLYLRGLRMKTL